MTFNFEQLINAYPEHLFVEFSEAESDRALPPAEDYSSESARQRAHLNRLCLNSLVPVLQEQINLKNSFKMWPHPEALPTIWEVVNGTAITVDKTRIVLIPSEAIDTEELRVPAEWVDIPDWAVAYYLAVQVNLSDGWLRVWGFATHKQLKKEGNYDACDRTYSLDSSALFEDINVMAIALKRGLEEKAEIEALPALSPNEVEKLLAELGKPSLYSPRLKVAFPQWAAILTNNSWRQQLYERRTVVILSQWRNNVFEDRWLSVEELESAYKVNLALSYRSASRSGENDAENSQPNIVRGRIIDLGIQLAGHFVALIVRFTPQTDGKCKLLLQVHPAAEQIYLPPGVQLSVLDDAGAIFLEAQSRSADNWIQLEFRGDPGERFCVRVALGDAGVTENFVI